MTKLSAVVLPLLLCLVGLAGCTLIDQLRSPPKRVCGKVARLCSLTEQQAEECVKGLGDSAEGLGKERMDKLVQCVSDSASCPEAAGCMAGTGVGVVTDQLNKFLKGVGKIFQ